jgi:hypothetical protein
VLITKYYSRRVIESRVFRAKNQGLDFSGGILSFAGHLVSPTVSEASEEGRPTISNKTGIDSSV